MPASSSISATAALHSADTSGAGAEAEDNYDYVVEMITDVRSTHANIINKLMEKVPQISIHTRIHIKSFWQSTSLHRWRTLRPRMSWL